MLYFNMKLRLKWNKIVLAAKIILFHLRCGSMLKLNIKILKNNFILTWSHGFTGNRLPFVLAAVDRKINETFAVIKVL